MRLKSKQATSRKKALDKINLNDMRPSNRRYPGIIFNNRAGEFGDQILEVNISHKQSGEQTSLKARFDVRKGQKLPFMLENSLATTAYTKSWPEKRHRFWRLHSNGASPSPQRICHQTTVHILKNKDMNLVDWLKTIYQLTWTKPIWGAFWVNAFQRRRNSKNCNGSQRRKKCVGMLSRMMTANANVILLDEPTNHLDLESITALNNGLVGL